MHAVTKTSGVHCDVVLECVEHSMLVAIMEESEKLEHQISLLGTMCCYRTLYWIIRYFLG